MDPEAAVPTIRRSVMYTPATRPDRVRKGLKKGADTLVVDLEDAVGPEEKEHARTTAANVAALPRETTGTELAIRVNAADSPWFEPDLAAMAEARPQAVVLPKVEDVDTVRAAHEALGDTPLLLILETARGLARAFDVAAAAPTVSAVVFGAEDYAASVGAVRSPANTEVLWARSRVVAAARAAGAEPIDQVFVDFKDTEALLAEAREARALGFSGKQCIHPAQIEPIHEAFSPTKEEVDGAFALLAAVREAGVEEGGVINFEGRMVDRPLIEQAKRVAALASQAGIEPGP